MQENEELITPHSKATIVRFEYNHWSVHSDQFVSSSIQLIYDSTLLKMTPAVWNYLYRKE